LTRKKPEWALINSTHKAGCLKMAAQPQLCQELNKKMKLHAYLKIVLK